MKNMLKISLALSVATSAALFADEPANVNLEEIKVVSATGYEQNIADAPASISVITQENIKKRNYQDLADIVNDLPSDATYTLGAASKKGISLRGLGAKYTKILIDGRPATSDSAYKGLRAIGTGQNFLPPASAIERVEVIRGPMSSLYGSDAMGGVINIITKGFSNEISGSVGGYYTFARKSYIKGDYQSNFYLNGALVQDVLGFALDGKYFKKIEDKISYGSRENDEKNFGAKLMYKPTDRDDVELTYRRVNNDFRRSEGRTLGASGTNDGIRLESAKGYNASLSHSGKYDKLLLESYLSYDDMKESGQQDLRLKTTTLNSKGTYFFDSNTLTLGAQYRRERLNEEATTADAANVKRWDYSLYGEDSYFLTDALTLTAGARYNRDKDYGGHLSPRGYLVYHLTDALSLKGGVSTGYSTPDIKQRTDGLALPFAGGRGAQLGNSSLKPEKSVTYEAGVAYEERGKYALSATVFRTDFKDGISTQKVCMGGPSCRHKGKVYPRGIWNTINIGKAEVKGVELTADYDVTSDLALHANYTYNKSKQKTGDEKGHTLNNLPVHVIKLGADYDLNANFNLWSQMNYLGRTKDSLSYDNDIESYVLFDLGLTYKITKNASVNLSAYNVFNEHVVTRSGRYDVMIADGAKYQIGFNVNF